MTDPRNLQIADYMYELPSARIATRPPGQRDGSKLLICQGGNFLEDLFKNILHHLPANALMVFNNTRVVEARLLFQKPTGAGIELFCLEPGEQYPDISIALLQQASVTWKCLVGNASAWNAGLILEKVAYLNGAPVQLRAAMLAKTQEYCTVQFTWTSETLSFAGVLHLFGVVPLPPYIRRKAEVEDAGRYQTVYAQHSGSVAAPTAGLHFTDALINSLGQKNIHKDFVTLHVGAGTFMPVKSALMGAHQMHAEFMEISYPLLKNLYDHADDPLIAVGTTSLRSLESLYWLGRKLHLNADLLPDQLQVLQWEPYDPEGEIISVKSSLLAMMQYMDAHKMKTWVTKTSLLISPGYPFKMVDILITNFHQPGSTLLLLVSAFIGEQWKSAYEYALKNEFRFLSYGDACLLFRQ